MTLYLMYRMYTTLLDTTYIGCARHFAPGFSASKRKKGYGARYLCYASLQNAKSKSPLGDLIDNFRAGAHAGILKVRAGGQGCDWFPFRAASWLQQSGRLLRTDRCGQFLGPRSWTLDFARAVEVSVEGRKPHGFQPSRGLLLPEGFPRCCSRPSP